MGKIGKNRQSRATEREDNNNVICSSNNMANNQNDTKIINYLCGFSRK
jgi:hypothetical protein